MDRVESSLVPQVVLLPCTRWHVKTNLCSRLMRPARHFSFRLRKNCLDYSKELHAP